jgi:hypothetical protein
VGIVGKFAVARAPSHTESVEIRASASFGTVALAWTGAQVTVSPSDREVTAPLMTSGEELPDEVGFVEAFKIDWEANPAGTGWADAGSSKNLTYVTLGRPDGTPNYWTLLEVSCRGATGARTASELIQGSFALLRTLAITRKRDGQGLTYWKPRETCRATNTYLLLNSDDGAGQCGSWAEFLRDMHRAHGVTSSVKVLVVRTKPDWRHRKVMFLVKNWTFDVPPVPMPEEYTHRVPEQCRPGDHLPGQRNETPPPRFYNHFIVRGDGVFWDPSYGSGPTTNQVTWEVAAIDGLVRTDDDDVAGYPKFLNLMNRLLEFWDTSTDTRI